MGDLTTVNKTKLIALRGKLEPAPQDVFRKWLASLGTLCAGNVGLADAEAKITAYAAMFEAPIGLLNKTTLDRAAREFKFFPTYGEIVEFFEEEAREIHREINTICPQRHKQGWEIEHEKREQNRADPKHIAEVMAKYRTKEPEPEPKEKTA